MREIKISAEQLADRLLELSEREQICMLDSCGVNHLNSRFLIAGVRPLESFQITNENPLDTLRFLDEKTSDENFACVFTLAYEFGLKLENISSRQKEFDGFPEPDIYLARFDSLIVHDYDERKTFLVGNENAFNELEALLAPEAGKSTDFASEAKTQIESNFTRGEYVAAIERIKEFIRRGDTYQTNLTRQIRARLPENLTAPEIFRRLRSNHPAPFAAFIKRENDAVISASPERFFRIQSSNSEAENRTISTSPIKGTRPRGRTEEEDLLLKNELLASEKDRAENVMIVDLLRNDIGRICEFGSVAVEKLCELETHPTLFHLVSTITGKLREDVKFSDIIRAVFPCGSITGAPKINTMRIIDELETAPRGLSMGAIGFSIPNSNIFHFPFFVSRYLDLSVAIRTLVLRGREVVFNVGGGIVIDSDAAEEYAETQTKARALLDALDAKE